MILRGLREKQKYSEMQGSIIAFSNDTEITVNEQF